MMVIMVIGCLVVGNFGLSGELDDKHDDIMTRFDRIEEHPDGPHTEQVGISGTYANAIGGWFTVMTWAVMPMYVIVLFTGFWFDNIREEQSLQPYFI